MYRTVFAYEHPDVEFLSVGNSGEVKRDHLGVANAIEVIAPGTQIVRLVDRDEHSDQEIAILREQGVRVLSRRNIECYLLADEILQRLCNLAGQPEKFPDAIQRRDQAVQDAASNHGRAPDDFKSASGAIQVFAQRELSLRQSGSDTHQFLRETAAPLLPGTETYRALRADIFG